MSWIPIYSSWFIFSGLVCFFFWKFSLFVLSFVGGVLAFVFLIYSIYFDQRSYASAFWLFILSEVFIFGTLFVCCLWGETDGLNDAISPPIELPFLGCFILIGSSMFVTTYHHFLNMSGSFWWLLATVLLGSCFIIMQLFEFFDCGHNIFDSFYHSCCFCTVGLHFVHVLVGLIALSILLIFGEDRIGVYYASICVWYWHFVDYIWLFVYIVVYMAGIV